jgi:membrane protease subunit (stomatin/prohibitin family)
MVIFLALVLTLLSFAAIAVPLYRNQDNSERAWIFEFEGHNPDPGIRPVMAKQIEMDYRTGILSEEDYLAQKASMQVVDAAGSDAAGAESNLEDEIEKRVAGLRRVEGGAASDEIEAKVRQLRRVQPAPGNITSGSVSRQKKARFCPQCGSKVQPGARFCSQCGEDIS